MAGIATLALTRHRAVHLLLLLAVAVSASQPPTSRGGAVSPGASNHTAEATPAASDPAVRGPPIVAEVPHDPGSRFAGGGSVDSLLEWLRRHGGVVSAALSACPSTSVAKSAPKHR